MAKVAGAMLLLILLFLYPGLLWLAALPVLALLPFVPALVRELVRKPVNRPDPDRAAH